MAAIQRFERPGSRSAGSVLAQLADLLAELDRLRAVGALDATPAPAGAGAEVWRDDDNVYLESTLAGALADMDISVHAGTLFLRLSHAAPAPAQRRRGASRAG